MVAESESNILGERQSVHIDHLQPENRERFETAGGVTVLRATYATDYQVSVLPLIEGLDTRRGAVLSSNFEFPNRYTRWDFGFVDPPLEITARDRTLRVRALNGRGEILAGAISAWLAADESGFSVQWEDGVLRVDVPESSATFAEEERTRQVSIFSVLRRIIALFYSEADSHLGLYGAFGYDLAFQLEGISRRITRPADQRDLLLYLPDEILVVDHLKEHAKLFRYDFIVDGRTTEKMPRDGEESILGKTQQPKAKCDHAPGEYAAAVEQARKEFYQGNMYECVLTQTFFRECGRKPSEIYNALRQANPAPYGALFNLGDGEFLVAASPEMFVRVIGRRVETCPISGTIARGRDPVSDADQILALLNSAKDAAELTMCTDVDRNDKSRVCVPGTVSVIGRRQVEMYSRLIHTVDHVEGLLREDMDALDAFLTHTWAVTVTGAPKRRAMQFVEAHEKSSRRWYGGAIGFAGFNGNLNTGLTLRTIRLKDGMADVRVGATLLYDSVPEDEDEECALKVSAMLGVLDVPKTAPDVVVLPSQRQTGVGKTVMFVDHEDSFVLMLADYFRQTGATVKTLRPDLARQALLSEKPDLVVLSPGPGRPGDFEISQTITAAMDAGAAVFGVCLGVQGIVEHFGGQLDILPSPMHGRASAVALNGDEIFVGLPPEVELARYHSLYADAAQMPDCLDVIGRSDDGIIMAVAHKKLAVKGVQFHPESILSTKDNHGLQMIVNVMQSMT